jgi:rubrerythrin
MEACHRYQMFASQLGRTGGYDAGSFFASMAENEAKHGQDLEARRKELFGDTPARLTLDDIYDVEAPEMGAPRRGMSVVQAFELGLEAEKKAYEFYDMALPGITNEEVRDLFTELRDEETEHVEMLKAAMAKDPLPVASDSDSLGFCRRLTTTSSRWDVCSWQCPITRPQEGGRGP